MDNKDNKDKKDKPSFHLVIKYLGQNKCKVLEADPIVASFFKLKGFYNDDTKKDEDNKMNDPKLSKMFKIKVQSKHSYTVKLSKIKHMIIDIEKYTWKFSTITRFGYIDFHDYKPIVQPNAVPPIYSQDKIRSTVLFYGMTDIRCILNEMDNEHQFKQISKELSFYRSFFDHVRSKTTLTNEMMQLIKEFNDKMEATLLAEKSKK